LIFVVVGEAETHRQMKVRARFSFFDLGVRL
jgi:hypothetical protein